MEEMIVQVLIAVLPSATAVVGVVSAVLAMLKNFKGLKREFEEKTDFKEIQKALGKIVEENQQLKKEVNQLKTQIDHVRREV